MKSEVLKHFKNIDTVIYELLNKYEIWQPVLNNKSEDYFKLLCHEIVGQQLSGKAANAIIQRFDAFFKLTNPNPKTIIEANEQDLRDVGMSWAKVRAVKDLASKTLSNELKLSQYPDMNEDEILENLLKVKGIGPWTVEMFLIFTLGREDVFSIKDLGLKKSVCLNYNLNIKGKNLEKKIIEISQKWTPYRSYASLVLWKSLDNR